MMSPRLFRTHQIGNLALPSGESEIRPGLDLRIAIVFAIPLGDLTCGGEPNFVMTFGIADKFSQQQSPKRPPADKRVVAPHHELGIARSLFVKTIKTILPHLQEISRRSAGALIARVIIEILKV